MTIKSKKNYIAYNNFKIKLKYMKLKSHIKIGGKTKILTKKHEM